MPVFKVQAPDGMIIKVEAADQATAIRGAQEHYASKRSQPPKKTPLAAVAGVAANINRGLIVGDEIAAGLGTIGDIGAGLARGELVNAPDAYSRNLAAQRGIEDGFSRDHPNVAALARGTGGAATALAPIGPSAAALAGAPRAVNMARGAVTAGAYGAASALGDRGSLGERVTAAGGAAINPVSLAVGAAGGAIVPAAGKKAKTMPKTDGDVLADVGVSTSIPQRLGRAAKGVEDILKRFPITGQAMAGYQDRQIGQLNRAVGLKALQTVGKSIPKEIKAGFEMVEYVDDALGEVYDRAAKLVPKVRLDRELQEEFREISNRAVDLPDSEAAQFERIIKDRTQRLQDGASGAMVKKIHSELGKLQAEAAKKGQDTLSGMIGETRRAIMGTVARANPQAGRLINRADQGWGIYSIMNDAAAQASGRGGVFLPGQLNTQVRGAARRMGSNMAGKGKGPLQDIATAAARTIPDSYGNPGTANAAALGSGGVGIFTAPAATAAAATGLGAVATPYFLMGRKLLESLPEGASPRQLTMAARQLEAMAKRDPNVIPLYQALSDQLSRGAGAAAATSRPTVEVSVEGRPDVRGTSYGRAGR